jgi:hypothetical protein
MSHETTKAKGDRASVHISADPAIRDYVLQLREATGQYAVEPKDARAMIDAALGQTRLTDALYEMRRDDDVV